MYVNRIPLNAFVVEYVGEIIDEKMRIPADAWASNPLLAPTPEHVAWAGPADGALHHDHYVYGAPREHES